MTRTHKQLRPLRIAKPTPSSFPTRAVLGKDDTAEAALLAGHQVAGLEPLDVRILGRRLGSSAAGSVTGAPSPTAAGRAWSRGRSRAW